MNAFHFCKHCTGNSIIPKSSRRSNNYIIYKKKIFYLVVELKVSSSFIVSLVLLLLSILPVGTWYLYLVFLRLRNWSVPKYQQLE